MKIGDYIKSKFGLWSIEVSEDIVSLELSRVNLNSQDEMTSDVNLDEFYYNVIPDLILMASNVSEGGYSISYNKDAMISFFGAVCSRLKKPNPFSDNSVQDITDKW